MGAKRFFLLLLVLAAIAAAAISLMPKPAHGDAPAAVSSEQ